jgi:membrane protease YdiL (CAAX protease family)
LLQYVRALSPKVEFAIVVTAAFGYFIFRSLSEVFAPSPHGVISETHLRFLLVYEPITLIIIFAFLYSRGWSLQRIGFAPSPKESFVGLGLALAAYVGYVVVWLIATSVSSQFGQAAHDMAFVTPGFSFATVVTVSIVNPVFEEVLLCGYVVSALTKSESAWTAINVSVGIRLLCHLYQGSLGVIGIIPLGLIFAWWYVKYGRLWPVIVAHAVFDLTGLAAFMAR